MNIPCLLNGIRFLAMSRCPAHFTIKMHHGQSPMHRNSRAYKSEPSEKLSLWVITYKGHEESAQLFLTLILLEISTYFDL